MDIRYFSLTLIARSNEIKNMTLLALKGIGIIGFGVIQNDVTLLLGKAKLHIKYVLDLSYHNK